jgi:hypothetical protein
LIKLMQQLTAEFRAVTSESYHAINRESNVTYPYLTFDIDGEAIERNVEGFYIDVDIFDHNTSYARIFELEEALKDHFKDLKVMTDDLYVRLNFNGSSKVQTGDDTILRRNVRFYAKNDWRKK